MCSQPSANCSEGLRPASNATIKYRCQKSGQCLRNSCAGSVGNPSQLPQTAWPLVLRIALDDIDTTCLELAFEGNHQVVVGDWGPGVRTLGSFEGLQPFRSMYV